MMLRKIEIKSDVFSLIAIGLTIVPLFLAIKLSFIEVIITISTFMLVSLSSAILILIKNSNEHVEEINRLNEKVNIYKDLSELKAKVEFLFNNFPMKKKGASDPSEILIRIIQVAGILIAFYLILKALGAI